MMWWDYIVSVIAIGLGVISIVIALKSYLIARESDKKMEIIANEKALSIAGTLEDRRIELRNRGGDLPFNIWKCYTDLERANLFKKYMTQSYQDRIIKYLQLYFELLKSFKDNHIWLVGEAMCEADKHIRGSYEIVENLDAFEKSKHKEKLQKLKKELTIG